MLESEGFEVVLVTGGSGFLGQHIVRLLQERDDRVKEIRVLDLVPYVNKLNHVENKEFRSFVGSVVDGDAVRDAFIGVDCVIHCAAAVSYEFPPNLEQLERNNVQGTANVIALCVACSIPRLIFSSSVEVVLTPYVSGTVTPLVINQTESKLPPPEDESSLIVPGYAASKLRAEKLVLAADRTPLAARDGRLLRTISLRPTLLYGDQDRLLIPSLMRCGELYQPRTLVRCAGIGGKQQYTYVGNAAWAHLRAKDVLRDRPSCISGLPVFVTDDTPPQDLLRFVNTVTSREGRPPRYRYTWWYLPVLLAYLIAGIVEFFVAKFSLKPRVTLPISPRAAVAYLSSMVYLNRLRASIYLEYTPIFSVEYALAEARRYYGQLVCGTESERMLPAIREELGESVLAFELGAPDASDALVSRLPH